MGKRVIVSGRVQGVFFRDTCRREAVAAGVSGWVRNRGNGTVEALFEGDAASVDHMIRWVKRGGPPRAIVSGVEIVSEESVELSEFHIKPDAP